MKKRTLGSSGLRVSEIGLGCMGMSEFYSPEKMNDTDSIKVIHRYIETGGDFLDTADMYGSGINEELVGKAITGRREKVIVATKFGNVRGPGGSFLGVRGDRDYVKQCCEESLKRLKIDVIDLYYQHRVDPKVPIEETIGAMKELVQQGKVRFLGMSEAAPETIRKAMKVHPVAALQSEYSLWTREVEDEILPVMRELGIAFVAYSPLGRGFLSGQFKTFEDIPEGDYRRNSPRFQGDNFDKNMKLVEQIRQMASEKKCTPSQLALAWVLAQGKEVIPIPGTKRIKYLDENMEAASIHLSTDDLKRIDSVFPKGATAGARYHEQAMKAVNL
jgi:aryl-alcohol dehydrogenase-like predicted oxidoreductase